MILGKMVAIKENHMGNVPKKESSEE